MIEEKIFKRVFSLEETDYYECQFESCDFSQQDFSKIQFFDCEFLSCSLVATKLKKTRMQNISFIESKVMGIDFTLCDPTFFQLSFFKSLLRGCNFTEMKLKRFVFYQSDVRECHFVQSNLKEATFKKSNLEGSFFHHTNLEKADFRDAVNFMIDPINNSIKGAKFSKPEALALLEGLHIEIE